MSTGQGLASYLCKARLILLAELGLSCAFLAPRRLEQPPSLQSCGSVELSFSFSLLSGRSCCQNSEVWLSCVPGCGNPCAMKTLVVLRVRPFYAAVGCWRWWHAAGGGEAKFSGASHSARGVTRPRTAEHTECAVWIHIVCMPTLAALSLGLLPSAVQCLDVTDCSRMLVSLVLGRTLVATSFFHAHAGLCRLCRVPCYVRITAWHAGHVFTVDNADTNPPAQCTWA